MHCGFSQQISGLNAASFAYFAFWQISRTLVDGQPLGFFHSLHVVSRSPYTHHL